MEQQQHNNEWRGKSTVKFYRTFAHIISFPSSLTKRLRTIEEKTTKA